MLNFYVIGMKKIFDKVLIFFCMLFSSGCSAQEQKFVSYAPEEFEKLLKENQTIQLVDVRRPDEYQAGHIDKAILINVLDSDFMTKAKSMLDKTKPVAVYCRSGRRSKDAAVMLSKEGFKVYDLDGGFLAWTAYQSKNRK